MIRLGLLINIFFVLCLFQNGYSQLNDFGEFFGSCPQTSANTSTTLHDIQGKWYVHWVLGPYSPWKFVRCQINEITFKNENTSDVKTSFSLPLIPASFEWNGNLQIVNETSGNFIFDYYTSLGNVSQHTVFLQTYPQGVALLRTCFDFKTFHIDSLVVMTKYPDPVDPHIDQAIFQNMENTIKKSGISPNEFAAIDNRNCSFLLISQ